MAVRQASLAELAQAACVSIPDVRLALRRVAEQLKAAGMQVLDDGSHVQEQAEVLAIVVMDGMATRRRLRRSGGRRRSR